MAQLSQLGNGEEGGRRWRELMAMMREDEAARVLDWRVEIKLDLRWRAKIYFTTSAQIPHCELIR